ncbi:MAG: DUF1844 domain-containing protein [candidate division Zixibacteria bacterium]|nr:DUF1844 domain-containing protein [candidate division Zixibacteria bacterium]
MTESNMKMDMNFFQLVFSLQLAAFQQMGKTVSPISGKIERNLEQARASIDMLAMLAEKTKGNLSEEEDKFLNSLLYELRMNFLDESNKKEPESKTEQKVESKKEESQFGAS